MTQLLYKWQLLTSASLKKKGSGSNVVENELQYWHVGDFVVSKIVTNNVNDFAKRKHLRNARQPMFGQLGEANVALL